MVGGPVPGPGAYAGGGKKVMFERHSL